jgi:hypothetical protein
VISFGGNPGNKIRTYYFRHEFSVSNPAAYADLTLRVIRDDGVVVYLNDVEVARSNMPGGVIGFDTFASGAVGGADESTWQEFAVDPALLGESNVVAVEIHQANGTSSDVSFDLELERSVPAVPVPEVSLDAPGDGSVVNSTEVTFTCSASDVVGLSEATLAVMQVGGGSGTVVVSGAGAMEDAQISADTPGANYGSGLSINVDGQSPHAHAVMQVPDLIGSGPNRVPPGAVIESATLELGCTNPGNVMRLYRLLEEWVESEVTWSERRSGVAWTVAGADGAGSNAGPGLDGDCTGTGQRTVDITPLVQAWSDGAPNHGWVMTDGGTNGVDFDSSQSGNPPVVTVAYQASGEVVTETKAMSGTSDTVSFTHTLDDQQTYEWNCEVTNLSGGRSSAPSNFTVSVDTGAGPGG